MATVFDNIDVTVEAAFGDNPLDTSPSWTDISAYVRDVSISRGRQSEFAKYAPGTATIRLDNRDRRFDPEYTSGPYYGDLVPMVPVRVTSNYNGGTDYTLYYGFITGWPTVYNQANTDAVSIVKAIDANRLLGNTVIDVDDYRDAVVAENPLVYYPMQEQDTETVPFVQPSGASLTYTWDNSNASSNIRYPVNSSNSLRGLFQVDAVSSYNWRTVMFWCDVSDNVIFNGDQQTDNVDLRLVVTAGDTATSVALDYDTGFDPRRVTDTALLDLSTGWHFVVFTFDTTAHTYELIIDNVSRMSGSVPTGTNVSMVDQFRFSDIRTRTISHVATFAGAASSLDIAGLWTLGSQGYSGELSSTRLTRTLDDVSWPAAWRDIETGVQTVGEYRPARTVARDYNEQIPVAEQGDLFISRDGEVAFVNRTTTDNANIVALFDDDGTDYPFATIEVDANTVDAIRNSISVIYATDTVTVEDSASVTAYGRAQDILDARLIDDSDTAETIGNVVLAKTKDPRTRVRSLEVNVRTDPTMVPTIAQLELADDVVVAFTPTGVGDELWRAVRVQGVSHRITSSSWVTQLYLAPGPISTNGPLFVLDDDTYGKLSSGNKLG
jgi:hypothetical protein